MVFCLLATLVTRDNNKYFLSHTNSTTTTTKSFIMESPDAHQIAFNRKPSQLEHAPEGLLKKHARL